MTSFSAPTTQDLHHHWLWRCQVALPERGRSGILNRCHDVVPADHKGLTRLVVAAAVIHTLESLN